MRDMLEQLGLIALFGIAMLFAIVTSAHANGIIPTPWGWRAAWGINSPWQGRPPNAFLWGPLAWSLQSELAERGTFLAPPRFVSPPPVGPPGCATIAPGGLLNLRAVPNGPILGAFPPGYQLIVDGLDGDWAHVNLGGWMFANYLVPCGPPIVGPPPPPQIVEVPPPQAVAPPPPSKDQWRESIRKQGEKFCRTYPQDFACKPHDVPEGK